MKQAALGVCILLFMGIFGIAHATHDQMLNYVLLPNGSPIAKIDNPNAIDVSQPSLMSFLTHCETISREYIRGEYVCINFAQDLHNEAESRGIRAGIIVEGEAFIRHAYNVFRIDDENGTREVRVDISSGRIHLSPLSWRGDDVCVFW